MHEDVHFTDDELAEIRRLIILELESSRVESHQTTNAESRDLIHQRAERCQLLLDKIDKAVPGLAVAGA